MNDSKIGLNYTVKCKNRAIKVVRNICAYTKYLPIKCAQKW